MPEKISFLLGNVSIPVSRVTLGTWALGGGIWWGRQDDRISNETMEAAVRSGINMFDTAPVYGKGRSERLIGDFLRKRKLREKVILATKAGLSWKGASIFHDLTPKRILEEVDESRRRLQSDYLDLYQAHWPDPKTPISETARTLYELKERKIIKAVGVCNFSVKQMIEFRKYCPLQTLQTEYSLFTREIDKEIIPFCSSNGIAVLSYSPLFSGILTGKFFLEPRKKVPDDRVRREKSEHFREPLFSINRRALEKLSNIAKDYGKTPAQLSLNWNFSRKSIASSIAGARSSEQAVENAESLGWEISKADVIKIDSILAERDKEISEARAG